MNSALTALARTAHLDHDHNFDLRIAFGVACMQRVRHLIVSDEALEALDVAAAYVLGEVDLDALQRAARATREIAASHPGSGMIDGSGTAAVSATTGLARALEGRALDAAGYAAYAAVYAYSGSAVTDPRAYAEEFGWQYQTLAHMLKVR
ncbi:MAG: hypothetical protein AAF458_23330 [Pseudomonadota bacterium]